MSLFSRCIIAWKLRTLRAEDVTDTLEPALTVSGRDHHKPRPLSDNGPSCVADELADYIRANAKSHVRGAPMPPRHRASSNAGRILLETASRPAISNA